MTRQLNKGGLLLLLLLLAAAGLTSWLRTRPDIVALPAEAEAIRQIDFFMKNFRIRQYDYQGQLHYTFKGRQLNHYEADARTEISGPDMELAVDSAHWTVQADRAVTAGTQSAEEIRFSGNVRVQQENSLLIRTETLLLQPETEYMESLEPIVISGTGRNIEAASLRANLQTGIHTLTGVRARYVP
ncbi:MAG TPA: LPS export ABC transporter periplasmic protein LptC [Gammaproteobacteria bacterium]|nr:LPS export ABC transporter periplasmic protein LptC [Gammaproteobacteria bacterium]